MQVSTTSCTAGSTAWTVAWLRCSASRQSIMLLSCAGKGKGLGGMVLPPEPAGPERLDIRGVAGEQGSVSAMSMSAWVSGGVTVGGRWPLLKGFGSEWDPMTGLWISELGLIDIGGDITVGGRYF